MNRRPHIELYAALVVIGILWGMLGGCAQNQKLRLAQAEHTLEVVQLRVLEEAAAGNVSDEEALLIYPLVQSVRAVLDDAQLRIDTGDDKAFRADMRTAGAILKRLVDVYLVPVPPTTQPIP